MAVCIEVVTGDGQTVGPVISDRLIGSAPCARARGEQELGDRAIARTHRRLVVVPPLPSARPGQLLRLYDPYFPAVTGQLLSVRQRREGDVGWCTELVVDCPVLGAAR